MASSRPRAPAPIQRLLDDHRYRATLAVEARRDAGDPFDLAAINHQWAELYRRCVVAAVGGSFLQSYPARRSTGPAVASAVADPDSWALVHKLSARGIAPSAARSLRQARPLAHERSLSSV